MGKKYIFHYDQTKPSWRREIRDMHIAHDEMTCSAELEDFGVLDIVTISFDDGVVFNAFVHELEEVSE